MFNVIGSPNLHTRKLSMSSLETYVPSFASADESVTLQSERDGPARDPVSNMANQTSIANAVPQVVLLTFPKPQVGGSTVRMKRTPLWMLQGKRHRFRPNTTLKSRTSVDDLEGFRSKDWVSENRSHYPQFDETAYKQVCSLQCSLLTFRCTQSNLIQS